MKISYNIGWWLDVSRNENNIILSTQDDNGNEVEIIIEDGWLNRKRIKTFIKDIDKILNEEKRETNHVVDEDTGESR